MTATARDGTGCTRPTHDHDSGIATTWAVCWMAVCLTVGWIALVLAAAVARQHSVDGAADLASLSAAARLQSGGDPCAAAARVAAANGVLLSRCHVDGEDVVVTVRELLRMPFGIRRWAEGQARAGPV
ncbi:MAG: Rv3654c family TadE-like protein [Nocardioidaceae bacterium]